MEQREAAPRILWGGRLKLGYFQKDAEVQALTVLSSCPEGASLGRPTPLSEAMHTKPVFYPPPAFSRL